jgi:hypothetical protein
VTSLARKRAVAAVLLIALGALTWFFARPVAPAGQPPLVTIDGGSMAALRDAFNRDAQHVRVFILQSPT